MGMSIKKMGMNISLVLIDKNNPAVWRDYFLVGRGCEGRLLFSGANKFPPRAQAQMKDIESDDGESA